MAKPIDRRRAKPQKPRAEYIMEIREEAELQSQNCRRRWEEIRQVRNRTHEIYIPEAYKKTTSEIRTHWVGDILRRVVAHLTLNTPTVAVPPFAETEKAQRESTLREKWTQAVLEELDRQTVPMRWNRTLMDHAASYGMAVPKLVVVPGAWEDYPSAGDVYGKELTDLSKNELDGLNDRQEKYKQGRLPFAGAAVDPRTWWGFYSQRRLRECIEYNKRSVAQVVSEYNVHWDAKLSKLALGRLSGAYAQGSEPRTGLQTVDWVEHWTDTHVTYLADDVIVQQWEHGCGRVPYFPFYGLTNAMGEPGQQMESVVEHILDLVKLYDQLLTMWRNWAQISAFPMGYLSAVDPNTPPIQQDTVEGEGDRQTGPAFEFKPGGFENIPPGYKPDWLQAPPVGRDLIMVSDVIKGFIDEVIPNVLRGVGSGDQAGYAINQLITAAKIVYDPITDNASRAYEQMVEHIWWLVEHKIQEKVYVWGEAA